MPEDGKDPATGRFTNGNRFWEARSSHGATPKFEGPEPLMDACAQYFQWNADNPLMEAKAFAFQGEVTIASVPKMRAMTIAAMCSFIDIGHSTWNDWKTTRPDLVAVITWAEATIYQQKFEGASAEMLNANIIARDLGLADRKEHGGIGGGPIQTEEVSARDTLRSRIAGLAARGGGGKADRGPDGSAG